MGILDFFRRNTPAASTPVAITVVAPAAPVGRMDGWENSIAGFGTTRDKMQAGAFYADAPLDPYTLSALFYGDDMAATIVQWVITEAFRRGYKLTSKLNPEGATELAKWARETHAIDSRVASAATWGRLFGGCILILGAVDGGNLETPLAPERVKGVDYFLTVDKRFVYPQEYYLELGPKMGQPKTYRVTATTAHTVKSFIVHESRIVRFGGIPADEQKRRELQSWDFSVLQRAYDVLRSFGASWQGASNMLAEASQAVYTIKGLMQMLGSKQGPLLKERMQMMDYGRSTVRAIVLDDGEKFEKVGSPFTGIPEMLDRMMQRVSSVADVPVSILFGRSAAGMNATGDLDITAANTKVASYQTDTLGPVLMRLYTLLAMDRRAPTNGKPIPDLCLEWAPLSEPTAKEQAETQFLVAQADQIYLTNSVYDPAEIAIARAGGGAFSANVPSIDVDERKKELERREEFADEPPTETKPAPGKAPPEAPDDDAAPESTPEAPDDGSAA